MFNNMDKDEFMRMMQECHKSYMDMLWEKILCGFSDGSDGYGRDMGLPESAQQPKNVNKLIASADDDEEEDDKEEMKLPEIYLNIYLGGKNGR